MSAVPRQHVLDMIAELPSEILPDLVQFIEFLRFKNRPVERGSPSEDEARLIAVVRRRLPPADQRRLDHLRAQHDAGQATPEEHADLLGYVERVEREDAERAGALLELSRLRGVPLNQQARSSNGQVSDVEHRPSGW